MYVCAATKLTSSEVATGGGNGDGEGDDQYSHFSLHRDELARKTGAHGQTSAPHLAGTLTSKQPLKRDDWVVEAVQEGGSSADLPELGA